MCIDISAVTVASYSYNANNQRTSKTTSAGTTHYVYGAGGLLYGEYDASGNMLREYVYLNGEPLAQIDNVSSSDVLTYLHTDHLGTSRVVSNTSGASVWNWNSNAFGVGTPSGSAEVNLRFAGQYYDSESDLFYNWNRYYDPETGRYISSDPIGLAGGLNTFGYALANPIMYTDPDGLNPLALVIGFCRVFPQYCVFIGSSVSVALTPAAQAAWEIWKMAVDKGADVVGDVVDACTDEGDNRDCSKATDYQLEQAGIDDPHEVKKELGYTPVSRFDLCACKDGRILIMPRGQCGRAGDFYDDTGYRWK